MLSSTRKGSADGLKNKTILKTPEILATGGKPAKPLGETQDRMFPVITIDADAPEFSDQLGTKEKYWLRIENKRRLFKIGRPGTGGNWAERIAAELLAV